MFGWLSEASSRASRSKRTPRSELARIGFGQHLDRDVTAQPRIGGAIDLAHPARAEQRDDLVRADTGSRNQRHESSLYSSSGIRIVCGSAA